MRKYIPFLLLLLSGCMSVTPVYQPDPKVTSVITAVNPNVKIEDLNPVTALSPAPTPTVKPVSTRMIEKEMGIITAKPAYVKSVTLVSDKVSTTVPSIEQQISIPVALELQAPTTKNIGESFSIKLVVTPETIEVKTLAGTTISKVQVSNVVEARLTSSDFNIKDVTPVQQAILLTSTTEWEWILTPLAAGKHTVHLSVDSIVIVNDKEKQRSVRTLAKEIEISITATQVLSQWFSNNWQWLWTTILVPIGLWVKTKFLSKNTEISPT